MQDIHLFSGRLGNEMFRHAYLYSQVRDGVIPDWYVQNPKYFDKYAEEIRQMFGQGIGSLPYVGVHVRRGDYVGHDFYVNLADDTDYYEKAMALFPKKEFLIFSDDPEYCKTRFPHKVVEGGTLMSDFNGLASCEAVIMANSTFSWWAAYLSQNPDKTVAPSNKNWHPDGIERTVCPKEWTRID